MKKRIKRFGSIFCSLLCICSLMVGYPSLARAADNLIWGDLHSDGRIDATDALYTLRAVVGLEKLTTLQKFVADVNGDGAVNATDALEILRYIVGLAKTFSIPEESGRMSGSGVRIRSGPGTTYDILGQMQLNDEITVCGKAIDGWCHIKYRGVEGFCSAEYVSQSTPPSDASTLWARIYNPSTGVYETGYYPTYELLCRITEAEMGASFQPEALKAQVVAIHSYILYYNQRGKYSPSLPAKPMSSVSQRVKDAVSAVYNEVLCYQGSVIEAVYSASSAGRTNSAQDIWGGNVAYLQSVESAYDYLDPNWDHITTISLTELKSLLEQAGYSTSGYAPADWIKPIDYTSGNFVNRLSLCGKEVKGNYFRETILKYKIRSACFTATLSADGTAMVFTTRGYGHGVGMSQHGANLYAIHAGWNYQQILSHYYVSTSLTKLS